MKREIGRSRRHLMEIDGQKIEEQEGRWGKILKTLRFVVRLIGSDCLKWAIVGVRHFDVGQTSAHSGSHRFQSRLNESDPNL
jgi:hypothetical protein